MIHISRSITGRLCLAALIFCALSPGRSNAESSQVISLTPVADTGLYEVEPAHNLGAVEEVPAGLHSRELRSRLLLKFDPGAVLPAGATVLEAELHVFVTGTANPDTDYLLHRVLRSWGEGDKGGRNGAEATEGEASWLAAWTSVQPWTQPGGDFDPRPSAAARLDGEGAWYVFSSEGLAEDVQAFAEDPESNHGWILRAAQESGGNTARRIASRESASHAPMLVVRYQPPDSDGDGVDDGLDGCPDTLPGEVVDAAGCSLGQLAPCEGPWRHHGEYLQAFRAALHHFEEEGLLTRWQSIRAFRHAARSPCGRP